MVRSRSVKGPGSARTEGARRATGVRADAAAGGAGALAPGQRWSASRKRDVVLRLLRGESLDAVSREVGVELYRLEAWKERALAGLELGLKDHRRSRRWTRPSVTLGSCRWRWNCCGSAPVPRRAASLCRCGGRDDERHDLRDHGTPVRDPAGVSGLGALAVDPLRTAGASAAPGAGRAGTARADAGPLGRTAAGGRSRGPRSLAVPGRGSSEGARAAADPGRDPRRPDPSAARDARARAALAPPQAPGRSAAPPDGTIITAAPHVMWGTDGVRVFTVDDGWVWTFAAVDHWNAACVGWHVCTVGNRFAALEPIAHGLRQRYGSVAAAVARGLALRMDHGSQYLSDHFLHQIRYWGIRPSFGFVEEPETNGVAERWNRTLKEQATYGRVFQRLDDGRAAVADFVERYNQNWRLEKLGYQTPIEARAAYELHPAA